VQFSAIDVETANPCMGSICQIGIARFEGGQLVEEWVTLVDPEDYFDDVNVSIHGIGPSMVRGKPKLPDVAASQRMRSRIQSW
jgi:DNA polymerase-3 subunit epsilon